ncbi:hypothetical protein F5878DRAFT_642593 [Lentinula raphanica]|uniref:Uncharacterized protein n=1 Tax=Lentinula raphanica TaxID=153919 RepID=A0AA38UD60_9AGAR|nr:hypothetical protein F5878DRAFT_642593 [Lentinula raphanica]
MSHKWTGISMGKEIVNLDIICLQPNAIEVHQYHLSMLISLLDKLHCLVFTVSIVSSNTAAHIRQSLNSDIQQNLARYGYSLPDNVLHCQWSWAIASSTGKPKQIKNNPARCTGHQFEDLPKAAASTEFSLLYSFTEPVSVTEGLSKSMQILSTASLSDNNGQNQTTNYQKLIEKSTLEADHIKSDDFPDSDEDTQMRWAIQASLAEHAQSHRRIAGSHHNPTTMKEFINIVETFNYISNPGLIVETTKYPVDVTAGQLTARNPKKCKHKDSQSEPSKHPNIPKKPVKLKPKLKPNTHKPTKNKNKSAVKKLKQNQNKTTLDSDDEAPTVKTEQSDDGLPFFNLKAEKHMTQHPTLSLPQYDFKEWVDYTLMSFVMLILIWNSKPKLVHSEQLPTRQAEISRGCILLEEIPNFEHDITDEEDIAFLIGDIAQLQIIHDHIDLSLLGNENDSDFDPNDSHTVGSFQDVIQACKSKNKITNVLDIPMCATQAPTPVGLSTLEESDQVSPAVNLEGRSWALFATAHAVSKAHLDLNGFGTHVSVKTGLKYWCFAVPRLERDFVSTDAFLDGYDVDMSNAQEWKMYACSIPNRYHVSYSSDIQVMDEIIPDDELSLYDEAKIKAEELPAMRNGPDSMTTDSCLKKLSDTFRVQQAQALFNHKVKGEKMKMKAEHEDFGKEKYIARLWPELKKPGSLTRLIHGWTGVDSYAWLYPTEEGQFYEAIRNVL